MPVPALGAGPDPGMEEEAASGDGTEPWLANSNNNAAPVGWPCRRGEEPSYLQRVLLEIVESERTYARDLRGIVEVSEPQGGRRAAERGPSVPLGVPAGLPGEDHRCPRAAAAAGAGQRALWEHRGHL